MKLPSLASAFILLSPLILPIHAWGSLGHETVAYVATTFVSRATKTYFQTLLADDTPSYLANVSTWADAYRYTNAGRFSAPYHYIDANDSPPKSCGVTFSRDCGGEGCIVGAIQNYVRSSIKKSL